MAKGDSLYAVADRATNDTDGQSKSGDSGNEVVRANNSRCKVVSTALVDCARMTEGTYR